nr:hypothetical protein [Tanacetum cinerariifolium]
GGDGVGSGMGKSGGVPDSGVKWYVNGLVGSGRGSGNGDTGSGDSIGGSGDDNGESGNGGGVGMATSLAISMSEGNDIGV